MRKTREILRQKWELGRTHREVAESVGQSLGAVAATLARATKADRYRQWLKRRGQ
jgi:DNA-directed RNA polymerase specialized sigma24 family protein